MTISGVVIMKIRILFVKYIIIVIDSTKMLQTNFFSKFLLFIATFCNEEKI